MASVLKEGETGKISIGKPARKIAVRKREPTSGSKSNRNPSMLDAFSFNINDEQIDVKT
jgi:hypothetical protein